MLTSANVMLSNCLRTLGLTLAHCPIHNKLTTAHTAKIITRASMPFMWPLNIGRSATCKTHGRKVSLRALLALSVQVLSRLQHFVHAALVINAAARGRCRSKQVVKLRIRYSACYGALSRLRLTHAARWHSKSVSRTRGHGTETSCTVGAGLVLDRQRL